VVVPTRDRPRALSRCLKALAAQSIVDRLEVIVVDDGSTAADDIAATVTHAGARLLRGSSRGPAAARNAGARAARGSFLCFTDDDCEAEPDWAEQLVRALERGADAVAGTTLSRGGALAAASEIVADAPAATPPPAGSELAFARSNNLACTKAAFAATPFDESYPDAAGEDREWCARLLTAGYVLRSAPSARLVHRQELTLVAFLRQQTRYGRGAFRFRRRSGVRRPLESPAFYKALAHRAFAEGLAAGVLVCIAQAATAVGFTGAWLADVANGARFTNWTSSRSFRGDER
jgi:glycosyltransferase involved in cell wall biosynthesis